MPARLTDLSVKAEGYLEVWHCAGRQDGPEELVRLARRAWRVSGICLGPTGRPLAGVRIRVSYGMFDANATLVTDEFGLFQIDDLGATEIGFEVDTGQWCSDVVRVYPPEQRVTIGARPRSTRCARVPPDVTPISRRGTGVRGGASSRVAGCAAPSIEIAAGDTGRVIHCQAFFADGSSQVFPPWERRPTLRQTDLVALGVSQFHRIWRQPVRAGERIELVPPVFGAVRVRLRHENGEDVSQGRLALRWAGTRGGGSLSVEPARKHGRGVLPGTFVMKGVGPGAYDVLWFRKRPREVVLVRRALRMPDPAIELDLGDVNLPVPERLSVRVIDEAGQPVPRAVVRLTTGSGSLTRRADQGGKAVFEVQDPAQLEVEVWNEGTGQTARERLPPDTSATITVQI